MNLILSVAIFCYFAVPLVSCIQAFSVKFKSGSDPSDCEISVSGKKSYTITDKEKKMFGLDAVKSAVTSIMGVSPLSISFKSSETNHYATHGWSEVKVTVTAVSGEITSFDSGPTVLKRTPLVNRSGKTVTQTTTLSQTITNTIESSWDTSESFSIGETIDVSAQLFGAGVKSSTSLNFALQFGQGGSKSESKSTTLEDSVSVNLEPHSSVYAMLSSSFNKADAEVRYEVTLSGYIVATFWSKIKGRAVWELEVNSVLDILGEPISIPITQFIELGWYGESSIGTEDK